LALAPSQPAFYIAKLPVNLDPEEEREGKVERQTDLRALQSGQTAGRDPRDLQA